RLAPVRLGEQHRDIGRVIAVGGVPGDFPGDVGGRHRRETGPAEGVQQGARQDRSDIERHGVVHYSPRAQGGEEKAGVMASQRSRNSTGRRTTSGRGASPGGNGNGAESRTAATAAPRSMSPLTPATTSTATSRPSAPRRTSSSTTPCWPRRTAVHG